MVATKAANQKLNAKDLWPGLPWDWKDTIRIQDECRQRAIDLGITEEPQLSFAAAREWEKYLQQYPRLSERQKILAKIYPPIKKISFSFTEEELDYIQEKLFGSNEEVGQSILNKLSQRIKTDGK